jgi:hypothetical protein
MKKLYWLIGLASAVLAWLMIFGLVAGIFVGPHFEQLLADQLNSGLNGPLGKIDQIRLEVAEQRFLRNIGTIGGVVFGFVAGTVFSRVIFPKRTR